MGFVWSATRKSETRPSLLHGLIWVCLKMEDWPPNDREKDDQPVDLGVGVATFSASQHFWRFLHDAIWDLYFTGHHFQSPFLSGSPLQITGVGDLFHITFKYLFKINGIRNIWVMYGHVHLPTPELQHFRNFKQTNVVSPISLKKTSPSHQHVYWIFRPSPNG